MSVRGFQTATMPSQIDDLEDFEALLVSCLRRWIAGLCQHDARHWTIAWNDLAKRLGAEDARQATSALNTVVCEICTQARREFRHHPPCCGHLSADELAMLSLVAACQRRQVARARARAAWLVREPGVDGLLCAGMRLATALSVQGHRLPDRSVAPPPREPRPEELRPGALTVH